MRITIVTAGTRGDVDPYTGIGVRLRDAGHDVTVATHECFAKRISDCGLAFDRIPGDFRDLLRSVVFQRWQRLDRKKLGQAGGVGRVAAVIRAVRKVMCQVGEGIAETISRGADLLLLSNTAAPLSYHLAEELRIPSMGVYWGPIDPTGDFPPIMAQYPSLGRFGNRLSGAFAEAMTDAVYAQALALQRSTLGLPPVSLRQLRRRQRRLGWPILHGFSPAVLPRPRDWRPGLEAVGYWWPARSPAWRAPAEVVEFLAAGPPPVFIGFGSMAPDNAEQLGSVAVSALRRAGVRGIVQAGWAGLSTGGDHVISVGDIPHDWLFPQTAAVVHHAGAGTTGAALRAGVPSVPVPVMIDQHFWAARLARLGAAPEPLPIGRLSAEELASRIRAALDDATYRSRAAMLSRLLEAEDGAGRVVAAVERMG